MTVTSARKHPLWWATPPFIMASTRCSTFPCITYWPMSYSVGQHPINLSNATSRSADSPSNAAANSESFLLRLSTTTTRLDRNSRSASRSEEHTSELQSRENLVCRLLLEKKKNKHK